MESVLDILSFERQIASILYNYCNFKLRKKIYPSVWGRGVGKSMEGWKYHFNQNFENFEQE